MASTSTSPNPCPYAINRRYIHTESGLPLTVKYIGSLPPASKQVSEASSSSPTTWIGVEWDDPTRGRHSGTFQDLQVFRTRIPGSASFLKFKPAKRARTTDEGAGSQKGMLDEGKGFFQAVYERYIDSQLETDAHHGNTPTNQTQPSPAVGKVVLGSSNGQITVEMPNLDKVVRKLRKGVEDTLSDDRHSSLNVKEIGLEGQWVYGVDTERDDTALQAGMQESRWQTLRGKLSSMTLFSGDLSAPFANSQVTDVHTLNLSHNLIPHWTALAQICAELPNLRVLVVNFSRIEPLQNPLAESLPQSLRSAFANIEQLHICYSLVSWTDVQCFSSAFPTLRVLDLAGNALLDDRASVAASDATKGHELAGLTSLDLTDCSLDRWEDVMGIISQTPDLRSLNISSNPLPNIDLPPSLRPNLPALETIVMNNTRVQDWQSIDNLQILFGLSLRTFKFSLAEELVIPDAAKDTDPPDARKFKGKLEDRIYLIPKLPGLETLNGTTITKHERADAERFYLAQAAKLGIDENGTPGWGRINELQEIHGKSQNAPSKSFGTTTLKSKMIDVRIECPELGVEPFTLSLLPTAPLKLLKTKIARQLGVPLNSRFGLSVREAGMTETRDVADEDRTSVLSLDLKEGDVVVVEVL